eukprot:scaffold28131_cov38-Phaeocystis_antarctica.AAC.1
MLLTGRRGHAPGGCWSVTRPWPAGRGLAAPEASASNPRAVWVWSADPCAPLWPSSTGVSAPRYAQAGDPAVPQPPRHPASRCRLMPAPAPPGSTPPSSSAVALRRST